MGRLAARPVVAAVAVTVTVLVAAGALAAVVAAVVAPLFDDPAAAPPIPSATNAVAT